jgi:hypothetical protein
MREHADRDETLAKGVCIESLPEATRFRAVTIGSGVYEFFSRLPRRLSEHTTI